MKKCIGFTLGFLLLIGLVFPVQSSFAYPNGLLEGKEMGIGPGTGTGTGSTTLITDGDPTTYYSLPASVVSDTVYDTIWYEFDCPMDINGYQLKSDASTSVYLKKTDNTFLRVSNATRNGNLTSIDYKNIIAVSIQFDGSSSKVYEFDVFGSVNSTPPNPPTGLRAIPGDSKVTLTWDPNTEYDFTNYKVYLNGQYIGTSLTNTYEVSGLTNGVEYSFQVSSCDCAPNESVKSEVKSTPESLVSGRALLTIYIFGNHFKEYDLSTAELSAFLNWYDAKDAGSGPAKYAFTKTWNKGPFKTRTEYVIFDKIQMFDVDEYDGQP